MSRHRVVISGQEAHAGTTPMTSRKDPVRALSLLLPRLYTLAEAHAPDSRLTFGFLDARPGSSNTVPGQLELTVDIRHPVEASYAAMVTGLGTELSRACEGLELPFRSECFFESAGLAFDKRCIAAVRNGGAHVARGEILCFVDADSLIHIDTFNAIEEALSLSDIIGGATGVQLERWSLGIALTYIALVSFVILTRMDTGVVFCRRADFEEIGGYDERREMAEDVAFLWALRRLGRSRGQRLTRLRHVKAIASTRKFDRHGDWHYFTKLIPAVVPALLHPSARTELAQKYWYTDDR